MTAKKMTLTIENVTTLSEIPHYWSHQDYFELLKTFDIPVATTLSEAECIEYLQMAVSEIQPNEAAQILLYYKLGEKLNENQIEQISNDMLIDKISEEYPEIDLHCDLFSINQLLYKLYNGTFPNAKVVSIEVLVEIEDSTDVLTKEELLKYFMEMVSDRSIIKRLYADKLAHDTPFEEAESIIWKLERNENLYNIYTSEYWISNEQIIYDKIETVFVGADL